MLNKMALFDDLLYFKIATIKYVQQFKGKQTQKEEKWKLLSNNQMQVLELGNTIPDGGRSGILV